MVLGKPERVSKPLNFSRQNTGVAVNNQACQQLTLEMLICLAVGAASGSGFLSVGGSYEPSLEKNLRPWGQARNRCASCFSFTCDQVAGGIPCMSFFEGLLESGTYGTYALIEVERKLP